MTDSITTSARAADNAVGEKAVSRLADLIASMAPSPLFLTTEQMASTPQPAPEAVADTSMSAALIVV